MPFKSEAQRRRLHQLADEGKFDKDKLKEFDEASKGMKLPERIGKPRRKVAKVIR